ncbi:MAG: Rossmann-like and DUF2520 domain-containing protein [Planctomycetota bacterium]
MTIVGAGVIGTALGLLLRRGGFQIAAISSRTKRSASVAAELIGQGEVVGDPGLAAMGADIVLLAVPDRAIPNVSLQVATSGALKRGAVVAHLAGGLPSRVLAGVSAAHGFRGSLHPLQTFADLDTAVKLLRESFFFIEGDQEAVEVLRSMVIAIDGKPVPIEGAHKAVYHAGASVASNYLVALADLARSMLVRAGVPPGVALPALLPLLRGTLANLEAVGLPKALTGPIARGDLGTVRNHVRSLRELPGDMLRLYRELGRRTVQVAVQKGTLSQERASAILESLAEGEYHLPEEGAGPPAELGDTDGPNPFLR